MTKPKPTLPIEGPYRPRPQLRRRRTAFRPAVYTAALLAVGSILAAAAAAKFL